MTTKQEYEAYLNEKIRLGLADVEAGRVISKDDFLLEIKAFFAKLEQEQALRDKDEYTLEVIYG